MAQRHKNDKPVAVDSIGNPIGNLSDSLAALAVGDYGVSASSNSMLHRQHSAVGGIVQNQHDSQASNLSVLNQSLDLGWTPGGNSQ